MPRGAGPRQQNGDNPRSFTPSRVRPVRSAPVRGEFCQAGRRGDAGVSRRSPNVPACSRPLRVPASSPCSLGRAPNRGENGGTDQSRGRVSPIRLRTKPTISSCGVVTDVGTDVVKRRKLSTQPDIRCISCLESWSLYHGNHARRSDQSPT
jgi:hypothetical protein